MNQQNFDQLLFTKALADPTRQHIMEICCCEWLNVGQIQEVVGVSQPTVSHHLSLLKEANLVKVRNEGKHTFYILNQEYVAFCCGQIILNLAPDTDTANQIAP